MADNSQRIKFDRQEDGEWLRVLINGRRSPFGACVNHPSEAHLAFSPQDDLKTVMIEVFLQMINQGFFNPFGLAD